MRRIVVALGLTIAMIALPLYAAEEVMSKLFFDKWLLDSTKPLETKISNLQSSYTKMAADLQAMKSRFSSEIKVTQGQKNAFVDGAAVALDVAPQNIGGRLMVPVRFIGESLGASFSWNAQDKCVTYLSTGVKIELYIGKNTALVNGISTQLDAAPMIAGGRTMVPLRFVSQHMGAAVSWDAATQTATISK